MSKLLRRIDKGILLVGESSDLTDNLAGSIWYNSSTGLLKGYFGAAVRSLVTTDQTQTLTGKTIDSDSNTLSNIVNANIKAAAGIVYSKLTLTNSILNADINSAAAIAYSKLNLSGSIVNSDIGNSAAIAYSKLNLTGSIVNADVGASAAIVYSKLNLSGSILNADINASAGIVYSKLSLSNSILNADINSSAAIAYSKLNLSGSILNADINASAAIAYSKLNLSGSILNADVNANAAIAVSKLAAVTASRALVSDASGFISASSVTATELGYLASVSSSIQTQLNGKASTTLNNLGTTALNASLIPATDDNISLGSSSKYYSNSYTKYLYVKDGANFNVIGTNNTPSGVSAFTVYGYSKVTAIATIDRLDADNGYGILVETGNTVDGNSGDISLTTGVPSGTGARGKIKLAAPVVYFNNGGSSDPATGVAGELYYNTTSNIFKYYNNSAWVAITDGASHSGLANLSADDHTQYAKLAGRASSQTLIGGTGASENLTLESTSNGTKGSVIIAGGSKLSFPSNSQTTTFIGSPSASASVNYVLPAADGSSNYFLKTDGSGVLSWAEVVASGAVPVGSIVAWIGGHFGDGSNSTFSNILGNTVANVNTLLNGSGWYVCDGAALNLPASSIFNGANRYLPNLTDERFLQGNTTAGGIGGSNVMIDHTHTFSLTMAHTHSISHTHDAASSAADRLALFSGSQGTGSPTTTGSNILTGGTTAGIAFATSGSSTSSSGNASTGTVSGSVGSGSAASSTNIRPKYLSCFYIMRVV